MENSAQVRGVRKKIAESVRSPTESDGVRAESVGLPRTSADCKTIALKAIKAEKLFAGSPNIYLNSQEISSLYLFPVENSEVLKIFLAI